MHRTWESTTHLEKRRNKKKIKIEKKSNWHSEIILEENSNNVQIVFISKAEAEIAYRNHTAEFYK